MYTKPPLPAEEKARTAPLCRLCRLTIASQARPDNVPLSAGQRTYAPLAHRSWDFRDRRAHTRRGAYTGEARIAIRGPREDIAREAELVGRARARKRPRNVNTDVMPSLERETL